MTEKSCLFDKVLYNPRHDAATEMFLLTHEAIRWDLEEVGRHLMEPYFTGQPQKVHIFFRWFEGYFVELVRMTHARSQRILSALSAPSALPVSSSSSSSSSLGGTRSGQSSADGEEALGVRESTAWEQQEAWERETRAVDRIMREVVGVKHSLLEAQPDNRPTFAEELRLKVEELGVVLRRCMAIEEQGLVPWVRDAVDVEDARGPLEAELGGDTPAMGWLGLAMWMPWVIHAMERWCAPQDVSDFREGLPWLIGSLTLYMWEPVYMSSNWALLQSMADPLEDEDTTDLDDDDL